MANKKYTVHNATKGYRGLNAVAGYVELNPGETRENVEISDAEYANAKATGYFTFGADAKAADEPDDPAALPTTHAGLDKLATDEGVTFGPEIKTVADKQGAIAAARKAKADAAAGGGSQPDQLDAMDDDTLRNTAAAISGKPVADLAGMDRDALLKLARGEA